MYDHRVGFHRSVVRVWDNPSGSAVVACLNAAARTRRAARAVQGDVLSVWQVLHGTPSAPLISAQRGARFDEHCTSNVFINNKLRQRYSRSTRWLVQWPGVPTDASGFVPLSMAEVGLSETHTLRAIGPSRDLQDANRHPSTSHSTGERAFAGLPFTAPRCSGAGPGPRAPRQTGSPASAVRARSPCRD
jgi:hypothetical protein